MENLNDLEALALSTDAQANEQTAAAMPVDPNAPPEPPSHAEQASDMVNFFVDLACEVEPTVASIWPSEVRQGCARVIEPLLVKYNVSFTNIPPELMAVIVLGPPLWKTSKAIAAKVKSKTEQVQQPQQLENRMQMPTESPETKVHSQMGLYT